MLVMHGIGSPFRGFGAFSTPEDYKCAKAGGGNFVCRPTRGDVRERYKHLQSTVKAIAQQMAASGRITVPGDPALVAVDGDIGKITATWVQFIGAAFAKVVPPPPVIFAALAPEVGVTPEAMVSRIAQFATEIDDYFIDVAANFPEAIAVQPPEPIIKIVERRNKLKPIGAVVIGAGFLGALGFFASSMFGNRNKSPLDPSGF